MKRYPGSQYNPYAPRNMMPNNRTAFNGGYSHCQRDSRRNSKDQRGGLCSAGIFRKELSLMKQSRTVLMCAFLIGSLLWSISSHAEIIYSHRDYIWRGDGDRTFTSATTSVNGTYIPLAGDFDGGLARGQRASGGATVT
jgi:hypothetical protein